MHAKGEGLDKLKVLGIIPARGGSKGIPHKNIKELGGKPLIQYAIEAALQADVFSEVIVSTDSPDIASIGESLGAKVPFLRPAHLATDASPTIDTLVHLVDYYLSIGVQYDAICLLQPTTPLRTAADIRAATLKFQVEKTDSLISVIPVPHHFNPHWTFEVHPKRGTLQLATGEAEIIPRRQELPKAYVRNGAIYLTKTEVILRRKSLYGDSIGYLEMPVERSANIDTLADWAEAEKQLAKLY